MKYSLFSLFIFLCTSITLSSQSIQFLDVVQEPDPEVSVEASINERGGYIVFDRVYRSGCVGGYKVKVTFSKSLNIIQPGETFQATLSCEDCNTPCGYKWDIVGLFDSNNVTEIDQYPTYVNNGNIEFVRSSNGSSNVADWKPGMQNTIITLKYEPKKDVPLTAIKISVARVHDIFIVFKTGSKKTPVDGAGKPNLSCAWKSDFGDIHWKEGYYGGTHKTLSGELYLKNGIWVYEGNWGRTKGSDWGKVYFEFTSATEFTGYYTRKDGTKRNVWKGKGECLLIKY